MEVKEIFDLVAKNAADIKPDLVNYSFKGNESLAELGLNSVDRVEVIMTTLMALNLRISLVELSKARNMMELSELIYEKR
jgi:polyketide biosynthesis acyl carrier protein